MTPYSRDHRSDRPQIMIGMVMTANGFPLAHRVFPGNTQDAATLTAVLSDVQTKVRDRPGDRRC